ncbi:UDP-glycosyltransferase 76F1-like [Sesamum indicum]|uniref:UDP-glycosyltransferase 76F1-like n=1 Tax=Sesamum indicum TaxID=4182 RepID=A0A6I9THK4_SESIN|nr:UDP-glycosyltransferase 76F1-like [Sesamum indicum]
MENRGESQLQERLGRRLLFFPLPLQGHINPMLQLANILHSKGFSITIVHTKLNSPNPSNYPHFTFFLIDDGLSENSEASRNDIISLLTVLNVKCIEPFKQAMSELLADSSGDPIACLISDAILHFTTAVCKSLNLPRLVLRTGGVSSFLAFAAFPLLLEKGYLPVQDAKSAEPVKELPPLRIKDLPVITTSHPEKLYRLVEGMIQETKASSGLIWNSFEELEESSLVKLRQDFQIPIFPIGPFHKHFAASSSNLLAEDHSSISWLDKQAPNSVIYVSFGSIAAIEEKDFLEVAWGLAKSRHPFLWVVRPGLIHGAEWLEPLPEGFLESLDGKGHIVKWAPQLEVLAHPSVGAFWTHNGWNSTLESICEGVPMICTPCFTDQLVNARYVSHFWKVGVQLENGLSREKIEMVIKRVMEEKEGEEVRERVVHLQEKANLCVQPGGSSYESLKSLVNYISLF